jgi:hypothetical protein
LYSIRLEGGQAVQMSAVYIPLKDGAVYGQLTPQGSTYFMVKDNGVINILAQGSGTYQKYTYFSRLMEICTNSTVTTTVAGEQLTVTNSQCTPSAAPLPTAKKFDELVLLLQGLPGPASQSHWQRSGTAQTPFGQATVYTNTTEIPIMVGLNAVLNYAPRRHGVFAQDPAGIRRPGGGHHDLHLEQHNGGDAGAQKRDQRAV